MGRGAWQVTVLWVAKSWTELKQLNTHTMLLHIHFQLECNNFGFGIKTKFKLKHLTDFGEKSKP